MVNLLAVYLFVPLPLVFIAALFLRRGEIWVGLILGALAFIWFWGSLFLPSTSPAAAGEDTLSVMTYNVLGWHTRTAPLVDTIRGEDADVVLADTGVARRHAEVVSTADGGFLVVWQSGAGTDGDLSSIEARFFTVCWAWATAIP